MAAARKAVLSKEDEASIRQGFADLDEVNHYWDANAREIHEKYHGQWVAFVGSRVVAHEHDADVLARRLDLLGAERERCVVRYVPSPETEFVF